MKNKFTNGDILHCMLLCKNDLLGGKTVAIRCKSGTVLTVKVASDVRDDITFVSGKVKVAKKYMFIEDSIRNSLRSFLTPLVVSGGDTKSAMC